MASCQTPQWSNSSTPYVKLTVTETASTATTSTLGWKLQYIAPNSAASTSVNKDYTVTIAGSTVKTGSYDIDGKDGTYDIASGTKVINKTTSAQSISFGVSFTFNLTWSGVYGGTKTASGSISVAAKTSYTVSYNANGGSGAPAAQKKWHGTDITLSSTKPTRTGYSFAGWATSTTGAVAYAAGAKYTADKTVTLYAKWTANTYTVSYNDNGGSGAPAAQTKTYGVTLTLSTTVPTRKYYTFLGWSTSSTATSATYAAGGNYTSNSAATLYAVWELAYVKPRITNMGSYPIAVRCDSAGTSTSNGTYAHVRFNWACDYAVTSIKIEWALSESNSYTHSTTISATGTSGSVNAIVGSNALDVDLPYKFRITVQDDEASMAFGNIPGSVFGLDLLVANKGIAFGKKATISNVAEFAWPIYPTAGFRYPMLENNASLKDATRLPGVYIGDAASSHGYTDCPITTGASFTLEVFPAGSEGQIMLRLTTCSSSPAIYHCHYYKGAWYDWVKTY